MTYKACKLSSIIRLSVIYYKNHRSPKEKSFFCLGDCRWFYFFLPCPRYVFSGGVRDEIISPWDATRAVG